MKKYIVLWGMLFVAISSGGAFGDTSLTGCCSAGKCQPTASLDGCANICTSDSQCSLGGSCPSECPSIAWETVSGTIAMDPGYEKRCQKLLSKCEYRCAAGSYGNPTSSTSGCTRCPVVSGGTVLSGFGNSVPGMNSAITGCYAVKDTEYSDTTGTFEFKDSNCYYTN